MSNKIHSRQYWFHLNFCWLYLIPLFLLTSCASPKASFVRPSSHINAPDDVSFDNKSVKAERYLWEFGDGSKSEEMHPTHRYLLSGTYQVTLTAFRGGKMSKYKDQVYVNPPHDCLMEISTNYGTMVMQLNDETPLHRDNFIKLSEAGFYDGLLFHRVVSGFMVQGGDPDSRTAESSQTIGGGGPGYTVPSEINLFLHHTKGAVAAARTADQVNPKKESSGSQFYIVHGRPATEEQLLIFESQKGIRYDPATRQQYLSLGGAPQLDQEYTVFARIISGLDIIDKIATVPTLANDRPKNDVIILKIRGVH